MKNNTINAALILMKNVWKNIQIVYKIYYCN